MMVGSAIGGLILQLISSEIYGAHVQPDGNNSCFGTQCYMMSFVITGITMIVAVVLGAVNVKRIKTKEQFI